MVGKKSIHVLARKDIPGVINDDLSSGVMILVLPSLELRILLLKDTSCSRLVLAGAGTVSEISAAELPVIHAAKVNMTSFTVMFSTS